VEDRKINKKDKEDIPDYQGVEIEYIPPSAGRGVVPVIIGLTEVCQKHGIKASITKWTEKDMMEDFSE
jgi:hypothetical protein